MDVLAAPSHEVVVTFRSPSNKKSIKKSISFSNSERTTLGAVTKSLQVSNKSHTLGADRQTKVSEVNMGKQDKANIMEQALGHNPIT